MIRPFDTKRGVLNAGAGDRNDREVRKTNKPLMEKRRRARINHSLQSLKTILVNTKNLVKSDGSMKYARLEKADILEKTVRHFQLLRAFDQPDLDKYASGFNNCIKEVMRYLNTPDIHTGGNLDLSNLTIKDRLVKHLHDCVEEIQANANANINISLGENATNYDSDDVFENTNGDFSKLFDFGERLINNPILNTINASPADFTLDEHMQLCKDENKVINDDNMEPYNSVTQENRIKITSVIKNNKISINQGYAESQAAQEMGIQKKNSSEQNNENDHQVIKIRQMSENGPENNNYINGLLNSGMLPLSVNGQILFLLPAHYLKNVENKTKPAEPCNVQITTVNNSGNSEDIAINFEEVIKKTWNIEHNSYSTNEKTNATRVTDESNAIEAGPLDYSKNSIKTYENLLKLNMPLSQNDPMWRPW